VCFRYKEACKQGFQEKYNQECSELEAKVIQIAKDNAWDHETEEGNEEIQKYASENKLACSLLTHCVYL
jgi:hypothetical protein